jgi:hypothetical protein
MKEGKQERETGIIPPKAFFLFSWLHVFLFQKLFA